MSTDHYIPFDELPRVCQNTLNKAIVEGWTGRVKSAGLVPAPGPNRATRRKAAKAARKANRGKR